MEKYSFEFKKKMVESYLSGEGGFEFLSKKYSVPYTSLRNWVYGYEKKGENAYLKELRRLRLEEKALLKNSENYLQLPRSVQIERYSRDSRLSKGNLYVLEKTF